MCDCYKNCCESCWEPCPTLHNFFRLCSSVMMMPCGLCCEEGCERCCFGVFPCCRPKRVNKGRPYLTAEMEEIAPFIGPSPVSSQFKTRDALPKIARPNNFAFEKLKTPSREEAIKLADFWKIQGQGEHASIASFALFSQKLMAVGAPMEMLQEAFLCGEEEMDHARLSFRLASFYEGSEITATSYKPHTVQITSDLEAILVSTIKEACVNETLSAFAAAKQAEEEADPVVNAIWTKIAIDEAYHSSYGFRVVQWIIAQDPQKWTPVLAETMASELRFVIPTEDHLFIKQIADAIVTNQKFKGTHSKAASPEKAYHHLVRILAHSVFVQ